MSLCPSQEQLQSLLAETLPEEDRQILENHIEECPTCQEVLAHLTENQEKWQQYSSSTTTAFQTKEAILERIKQHPPRPTVDQREDETTTDESVEIRFPIPPSPECPLGQLCHFRMVELLGEGAFGVVYKAHDAQLQREVAVKVLKPAFAASDTQRARFEREANKAAAVRHDHVVNVYELGKLDDFPLPFMVMEFVHGQPLSERIRREKILPPEESANLARQVALGLAKAHEANVVHRDIKPANILLCSQTKRAKISDFGIAREFEGEWSKLTQTGHIVGTLAYMSPEHIRNPGQVDGRSDIYSLGVVLYEMLTGELPFRGLTHMVIQQHLHDEPPEPRKLNDKISLDLQTITLKCLAKESDKRYQTAEELADDLQRFLDGEPIHARPVSQFERVLRWIKKRPAVTAFLVTSFVAALSLVGAGVALGFNSKLQEKQGELETTNSDLNKKNQLLDQAKKNLETTNQDLNKKNQLLDKAKKNLETTNHNLIKKNRMLDQAKKEIEAKSQEVQAHKLRAERLLYIAEMNRAQEIWKKGYAARVQNILQKYVTPQRKEKRGWEWHYLHWLMQTASHPQDKRFNGSLPCVAASPDGWKFATAVWDGTEATIHFWDKQSKQTYTAKANTGGIHRLAFSPDGLHLAAACANGDVLVWENLTPQRAKVLPPRTLKGHKGRVLSVVFVNDDVLATGGEDQKVILWNWREKKLIRSLPHPGPVNNLAVSSDDSKLAVAVGQYSPEGKPTRTESQFGKRSGPSGNTSAVKGAILLWENFLAARPQKPQTLEGHNDVVYDVAFSPDGKTLASASFDHTVKLWDMSKSPAPGLDITLTGHHQEVLGVDFDSTGNYLVSTGWDMTVKVWRREDGQLLESFTGHRGVVTEVAFVGKSSQVVSSCAGGFVKFWDRTKTQGSLVLSDQPPCRYPIFDVQFLGDSGKLVSTSQDDKFRVWDVSLQSPLLMEQAKTRNQWGTISPDGKWVAVQDNEGDIHILPSEPGGRVLSIPEKTGVNHRPVFSPDGKRLAVVWRPNEKAGIFHPQAVVKIWDLFGKDLTVHQQVIPGAHCVAFHPDGNQLAVAVRDWENPEGLVQIKIWDLKSDRLGRTLKAFQGDEVRNFVGINEMAFSPNGKYLASANQDFTASVWDLSTGKLKHVLQEHMCFVSCVAFSPDSSRLASGSEDWTVKLWDLESGLSTITLEGHTGRVVNVSFSPDGDKLASTCEDGTIRVWPASLDERSGAPVFIQPLSPPKRKSSKSPLRPIKK